MTSTSQLQIAKPQTCTEILYTCIIRCIIQGLVYNGRIQVGYTGGHLYIAVIQVQRDPVYPGVLTSRPCSAPSAPPAALVDHLLTDAGRCYTMPTIAGQK